MTTDCCNFDWDDLRYVLAVHRAGTVMGAAKLLGVTYPTVLRRIQRIEKEFGVCIFDRLPEGYIATEAGITLIKTAETIETSISTTHHSFRKRKTELEGTLRLTTVASLMDFIVPPILASFHSKYPLISVKCVIDNKPLDIEKREADVALRATINPPQNLIGIRCAKINFGIYAPLKYLETRQKQSWTEMNWLYPDGTLERAPVMQWVRDKISTDKIIFRGDSFLALRSMAESGFGVTVLPDCIVRPDRCSLVRIDSVPDTYSTELWILTHPDLRNTAFVQVFLAHLATEIRLLNIN